MRITLNKKVQIDQSASTVNLRSKGPARKRNPPLKDMNISSNQFFFNYSYIGYKGILVYGKNLSGPMKSLRARFNYILPMIGRSNLNWLGVDS